MATFAIIGRYIRQRAILRAFGLAALAFLVTGGASEAEDAVQFFAGRSLRVIVGYDPGGGYDIYARLFANNLARFLPGHPLISVQYMPGAATEVAARYILDVAPRDGTVIGIPVATLPMTTFVLRKPGEGIDVKALQWIGRMDTSDGITIVQAETGVRSVADLAGQTLAFAATSQTGSSFMIPQALNRLHKANIKLVLGYSGTTEAYLAMDRGEVDGMSNGIWSQLKRTKPEWISRHAVHVLFQQPEHRLPGLETVPSFVELASNEDERRVFRLLASEAVVGRAFYVGPGVPRDRVNALRRAFDRMTADPVLKEEADKVQASIDPMTGEDLERLVGAMATYPAEVYDQTRRLSAP